MEWAKRHTVGFTLNVQPAEEWHAATPDGHALVAFLQDDRHRGGGRGITVRLYGEDPCAPRSGTSPVAPRRLPTFEELREAIDTVAPAGTWWVMMGQPLEAKPRGWEHVVAAPVWTELPPFVEVVPQDGPRIATPNLSDTGSLHVPRPRIGGRGQ